MVEVITESMISAAGVVEPNSDFVGEEPKTGMTLANDLPSGTNALSLPQQDLFSDVSFYDNYHLLMLRSQQRHDINRRRAGVTRPHESFSHAIYSTQAEEQQVRSTLFVYLNFPSPRHLSTAYQRHHPSAVPRNC